MKKVEKKDLVNDISDAYRYILALKGLLEEVSHPFGDTLDAARAKYKSSNDAMGSFLWMQHHFNAVQRQTDAATALMEMIERTMDGAFDKIDALERERLAEKGGE